MSKMHDGGTPGRGEHEADDWAREADTAISEFVQEASDPRSRHFHPHDVLNRVSVLAAFRLLAGGQHSDLLSVDAVERFPVEPPDGSVLKFTKTWGGPREYTYAALRCGNRWYTTSTKPNQQTMTWPDLVEFIHDNPCSIAKTWAPIPVPEPSPVEELTPAQWHAQMYPEV